MIQRRWLGPGERLGRRIQFLNQPPSVFYGGVSLRFRVADFDPAPEIVGDSGARWPVDYDALEAHYTFMVAPNGFTFVRVVDMLVFAVVGACAIAGLVRFRVRALARRAQMLEAMVAERTAELDAKNVELSEKIRQLEASERNAHLSERRALEANRANR